MGSLHNASQRRNEPCLVFAVVLSVQSKCRFQSSLNSRRCEPMESTRTSNRLFVACRPSAKASAEMETLGRFARLATLVKLTCARLGRRFDRPSRAESGLSPRCICQRGWHRHVRRTGDSTSAVRRAGVPDRRSNRHVSVKLGRTNQIDLTATEDRGPGSRKLNAPSNR